MSDGNERIRKFMAERMDREITKAFYGAFGTTSTVASSPSPPLTLAVIQQAIDSLPKPDLFVVTRMFGAGQVTWAKTPDADYRIVHPDDWPRLQQIWREATEPENRGNPLYDLHGDWIDADPRDDEEMARLRAKRRRKIMLAIAGTLQASIELNTLLAKP